MSVEPNRLQAQGIIEALDSSPWISNLVVVRKKTGSNRTCVDPREVNKAVIPDNCRYPLPTADELASLKQQDFQHIGSTYVKVICKYH